MKKNVEQTVKLIKQKLKESAPNLTKEQKERRNKILNSDDPDFSGYGHKMGDLEKLAKEMQQFSDCNYEDALEVFQNLIKSTIHEEKFMGVLFLNRFKRYFDDKIIKSFQDAFRKHCDTWALCDSSMIKVLGPFLAKNRNEHEVKEIVENWFRSEYLWVRRGSLVIYLKIVMIRKNFSQDFLSELIENFINDSEPYIQKAIAWLLRICSRYEPKIIFEYLMENKNEFSRLVLREGSKKLLKTQRIKLLEEK